MFIFDKLNVHFGNCFTSNNETHQNTRLERKKNNERRQNRTKKNNKRKSKIICKPLQEK